MILCNASKAIKKHPFSHSFVLFLECISGYYGENCNITCSHCNSSAPSCDRHNGYCLFGCEDGRNTTFCGNLFFFVVFGGVGEGGRSTLCLFLFWFVSLLYCYIFLCFMLNKRIIWKKKLIINRHYNDFEKYAIHSIYHMYRY